MPAQLSNPLKMAVATSVAPYGYTLTVWTSGAVTTHALGIPAAWEALLAGRGHPFRPPLSRESKHAETAPDTLASDEKQQPPGKA